MGSGGLSGYSQHNGSKDRFDGDHLSMGPCQQLSHGGSAPKKPYSCEDFHALYGMASCSEGKPILLRIDSYVTEEGTARLLTYAAACSSVATGAKGNLGRSTPRGSEEGPLLNDIYAHHTLWANKETTSGREWQCGNPSWSA